MDLETCFTIVRNAARMAVVNANDHDAIDFALTQIHTHLQATGAFGEPKAPLAAVPDGPPPAPVAEASVLPPQPAPVKAARKPAKRARKAG